MSNNYGKLVSDLFRSKLEYVYVSQDLDPAPICCPAALAERVQRVTPSAAGSIASVMRKTVLDRLPTGLTRSPVMASRRVCSSRSWTGVPSRRPYPLNSTEAPLNVDVMDPEGKLLCPSDSQIN